MLDPDDTPLAVDVADLQADRFRDAQSSGIGGGQRRTGLQAGHRFEEADDLVGIEHHRQLARHAGVGDALRHIGVTQRDAVEEPQRAHRLVQCRPRNPVCHQMHLKGTNLLRAKPVGRPAEMTGKLRHRMNVGSLRRRRQIADRHVLDHAPTQRAHLSHIIAPL
jgi:hypothetical protein